MHDVIHDTGRVDRGSWKLLNIRLSGLLPCSEAADAGEAAEVDDHSSTTVSSMPPGAPGALPVLPLGMCWQLQDGPDYHLSWVRGQGRLRRCGGVLWPFKRRKCVEIAKRALLCWPPRSGTRPQCRATPSLNAERTLEKKKRGAERDLHLVCLCGGLYRVIRAC